MTKVKLLFSHLMVAYLGAGLSLGLVMAQALPLNALGVSAYALTWPRHVYCASSGKHCFGMHTYLPDWVGVHMFKKEAFQKDTP